MAGLLYPEATTCDGGEMGDVEKNNTGRNGTVTHDYLEYEPSSWFEKTIDRVGSSTDDFFKKNNSTMAIIFYFILHGVMIGYFLSCLYYYLTYDHAPLELCYGFGNLIAVYAILYFFLFYFFVVKRYFGKWFAANVWSKIERTWLKWCQNAWFKWLCGIIIIGAIAVLLYFDTRRAPERLISLIGLSIILGLGFVFSKHPGRVNWRCVLSGLFIQFVFGLLFIRWAEGRSALQCFSDKVATFLGYGVVGAEFTFGELLVRTEKAFAFSTLPVIFFFSMLVEMLFYWGALQWFCIKLGRLLYAATSTTVCESVIAVGNVFLGNTESVLFIKPYLPLLTESELHVVMASGLATVSGTILASFIGFGVEPAHLVTASVMSAPAAICFAKLLLPETRRSLTAIDNIQPILFAVKICWLFSWIVYKRVMKLYPDNIIHAQLAAEDAAREDQSALSAVTRGATNGIALILNIIANIIAFVAFVAFLNGILGYCGGMLGYPEFNLEWIMGKVFIPLSWVMGVPWEECELVGTLIGLKTVVNEFVAYQRLGEMKAQGLLSARGELIATYSLCGFTNPASVGIMIGAIAAMAPNQRETLSNIAVRAFCAATGICFMTACIAGLLMPEDAFGSTS